MPRKKERKGEERSFLLSFPVKSLLATKEFTKTNKFTQYNFKQTGLPALKKRKHT